MIDRDAVLARDDREMRQDPPASSGATFERVGGWIRERHASDTIVYSALTSATAPATVEDEARRARALGRALEWKVYVHDCPPELPTILGLAAFRTDELETLVVRDLEDGRTAGPTALGLLVRGAIDTATFLDALLVSQAAFGPSGPELMERFRGRLDDPTARRFVAYSGHHPVSAGRLELPPGRAFAGLWREELFRMLGIGERTARWSSFRPSGRGSRATGSSLPTLERRAARSWNAWGSSRWSESKAGCSPRTPPKAGGFPEDWGPERARGRRQSFRIGPSRPGACPGSP